MYSKKIASPLYAAAADRPGGALRAGVMPDVVAQTGAARCMLNILPGKVVRTCNEM
ncbi:hypothetical protein [Paraburkholderia sp. DHOC27]|uniref:hypothetical protein n=1 Tax=Paraburkholderia sp. DHOC27 TaxID=2303330 RepID=UPI0015F2F578|nr:hypothetical protein [Paraburkholderia sp. DHOC27]